MSAQSNDIRHIKDLIPDPANARRHNPRNVGMIERALGEVGAARSIVVDEDGVILAGNATVEAAAAAGITRTRIIDTDGEEIIAVRRTGLTPEQKVKLALYDNRASELADWEPAVLAAIAAQDIDVSGLFTETEWAAVAMPGESGPVDTAELWKGMPEFEQEDVGAWKSIHVHFANEDDYRAFAQLAGQALTLQTRAIWHPKRANDSYITNECDDES